MASEFPRSPSNIKGALVVFEAQLPVPTNLIVFQYNPDEVRRTIGTPAALGGGAEAAGKPGGGGPQLLLPPPETLQLPIELDATDQLEFPGQHPITVGTGLHPTLAALELLLYPPSTMLILQKALSLAGASIMRTATAPVVLLVWGPLRVLPVQVTGIQIHEQAFDQLLNPIRAEATLTLKTLTAFQLAGAPSTIKAMALVNHVAKEILARLNGVSAAVQITVGVSF
ncbi:MAG: hypothetical protein ACRETX_00900 [Steroidobacteraceae bacterium]